MPIRKNVDITDKPEVLEELNKQLEVRIKEVKKFDMILSNPYPINYVRKLRDQYLKEIVKISEDILLYKQSC